MFKNYKNILLIKDLLVKNTFFNDNLKKLGEFPSLLKDKAV